MTLQDELRVLADELDAKPELADKLQYNDIWLFGFADKGDFRRVSSLLGGKRDKGVSVNGNQEVTRKFGKHLRVVIQADETCTKVPTGRQVEVQVPLGYETRLKDEYKWVCK